MTVKAKALLRKRRAEEIRPTYAEPGRSPAPGQDSAGIGSADAERVATLPELKLVLGPSASTSASIAAPSFFDDIASPKMFPPCVKTAKA